MHDHHHDHTSAAEIKAGLPHPVIDADGHWIEYGPFIDEELRRIGGDKAAEGFQYVRAVIQQGLSMSVEERSDQRMAQQGFWTFPARNTRDRATALMPRLLYERLDEFGIDFSIVYPTIGLGLHRIPDAQMRQATCRAYNTFTASYFADFSDRLTPAAVIPMVTPDEAISELEFVTRELGLKVIKMGSLIPRPIAAVARKYPEASSHATWFDVFGLDSEYDYDPVWAKCKELGLSPTFHRGSRGFGLRVSPSNFVFNHVGHFAAANEALCKALFLGGVTRRFPTVKFGFLEGGVGWACQLLADLIEHWEKRSLQGLEEVNPANLDVDKIIGLAQEYGSANLVTALRRTNGIFDGEGSGATGGISNLDDFSRCEILRKSDLRDLFVKSFYFGCEADDKMTAWAFNRRHNPMNARLNTLFGSDIGHFDVVNMADVLPEAYELVEDGLITGDDFREFLFANPVRFYGEANPAFFKGTVVEKQVDALLAQALTADRI
jgi:predicted TIM-barrel fold metal-dependent hydrolase